MREGLGEFEHLVLLAVARLGANAYGVPIIDELEQQTGRRVSRASVYVALKRLEKKELIVSMLGDPTPERSEEHTSELQSRLHLVCRLLLEKKKKKKKK